MHMHEQIYVHTQTHTHAHTYVHKHTHSDTKCRESEMPDKHSRLQNLILLKFIVDLHT